LVSFCQNALWFRFAKIRFAKTRAAETRAAESFPGADKKCTGAQVQTRAKRARSRLGKWSRSGRRSRSLMSASASSLLPEAPNHRTQDARASHVRVPTQEHAYMRGFVVSSRLINQSIAARGVGT